MFTQMRTASQKFMVIMVFVFSFIISGLFNTKIVSANDTTPPTILLYSLSNTYISPNSDNIQDSTSIDISFSETTDYTISIINLANTVIKSWSGSALNPQQKMWDGLDSHSVLVPDGIYTISISGKDLAGNLLTTDTSKTITVDTTRPVISLNGITPDITIGNSYTELGATCTDNIDSITLAIPSGFVDTNTLGTYTITYSATDNAGNIATPITRIVNVISPSQPDAIAIAFNTVHDTLSGENIDSNLNTVTSSNYTAFSGLYFEKSIDGVKMGRITFDSPLDLSSSDTKTFLESLATKLDMSETGLIGLDFSDTTINPSFKGVSATIKFYNLDKLGFTATSTVDEINSKLVAMDDNGNTIDKTTLIPNGANPLYIGACEVSGVCFTFSIPVNHFTKYKIGENTIVTTVTTSHSSGNYITPQTVTIVPILIGCAPESGDLYDVNTGIRCTVDTSKKIKNDSNTDKKIEILNKNPIITSSENTPKKLIAVSEITPVVNNIKEYIPPENSEESHLSGREKIGNGLYASVAKVSSIFHGPMSILIIIIIIIILLGGGYGVYGILTKNNSVEKKN